jgi:hypothetical protein
MTEARDSGIDKLTPKQQAFIAAYLECGNAAGAYRRTYACANMASATVQREATRLLANPKVNHTITTLRAQAAREAGLSRSWVLQRLMRNAEVSLGEATIKLRVQRKDKETGKVEVGDVEVTAHDATAANRALELLGKTDEVALFKERFEATGADGVPLIDADPRDVARAVLDILRNAQIAGGPRQDSGDEEQDGEGSSSPSSAVETAPGGRHPAPGVGSAAPPVRPRPDRLEPGEREVLDNGAEITFAPEFKKYAIHDAAGRLHGYRRDLAAARTFAASIKPSPPERAKA